MSHITNVVNLADYRQADRQELIDDISARTFLFLRDEAQANGVTMQEVIAEHLLGIALVVKAVEGEGAAQQLLDAVSDKLATC
jgi:hypothetical protein